MSSNSISNYGETIYDIHRTTKYTAKMITFAFAIITGFIT